MGGSQSVRKITIDNNSADVIKVSQSVVERLKNGRTDAGGSRQESSSEEAKADMRGASLGPQPSNYFPAYPYPMSSLPVQEEILKEVDKTNEYWKRRIAKLESFQQEMGKRMQLEYEKTMKQLEVMLPELRAEKEKVGDLAHLDSAKVKLIKCYKDNPSKSLNCAAEVDNFNKCFQEKAIALQRQRS